MVCPLHVIDNAESAAFATSRCWIPQPLFVDIKACTRYFLSGTLILFQSINQFEGSGKSDRDDINWMYE